MTSPHIEVEKHVAYIVLQLTRYPFSKRDLTLVKSTQPRTSCICTPLGNLPHPYPNPRTSLATNLIAFSIRSVACHARTSAYYGVISCVRVHGLTSASERGLISAWIWLPSKYNRKEESPFWHEISIISP